MTRKAKCKGKKDATIINIESPSEFSVRLNMFLEPFSLLKNNLNTFYHEHAAYLRVKPDIYLKVGNVFAIFSKSNRAWCRAQIIGIHSDRATLLLLDYGEKVRDQKISDLHILDKQFTYENAYAFYCHLPHLFSTDGSVWHSAAVDEMKRLIEEFGQEIQLVPVGPIKKFTDVYGCSVKSLPVEVSWTYTEAETPFTPDITRYVSLAVKLSMMQFAVTSNLLEEVATDNDAFDIPAFEADQLNQPCFDDKSDDSEREDVDKMPVQEKIYFCHIQPCDSSTTYNNLMVAEKHIREVHGSSFPPSLLVAKSDFHWLDPEIPEEIEFRARCTHVDGSGQIYLHLYENRTTMRLIREVLRDKYRGSGMKNLERLKVGQECIARYRDGLWYRARVLGYGPFEGYDPTEEFVCILFVDHGNTDIIKNKYIGSRLYCKDNPIQALRVVLSNASPWTGNNTWTKGCLDFMQKLLYDGMRYVFIKITGSNKALPLKAAIQIPPKNSSDGVWIDLGDLLVKKGEAMFMDTFVITTEMINSWAKESNGVGFVPFGTYSKSQKALSSKVPGNSDLISVSNDGKNLFPSLDLKFGLARKPIDLQLAEIVSYNKIFVHPILDKTGGEFSNLATLYGDMMEELQRTAGNMPPVIYPTDGLTVAARSHGEGTSKTGWFRGIIQKHSASKLLVQYVDYGPKTFWLDSDQVRELPPECRLVPVTWIELTLPVNVVGQEEDEIDVATAMMMEVLWSQGTSEDHDNVLTVRILSAKPQLTGHIINKTSGTPVYKHLENEGVIILYNSS